MNRFPELARAFPDFPLSDLPSIPEDWRDSSWHNDACPSFMVSENGDTGEFLQVYIDFADPEKREYTGTPSRFSVLLSTNGATESFDSNDWEETLAKVAEWSSRVTASHNGDFVLVTGTVGNGFSFHGPFETMEAAQEYGVNAGLSVWEIAPIQAPEKE